MCIGAMLYHKPLKAKKILEAFLKGCSGKFISSSDVNCIRYIAIYGIYKNLDVWQYARNKNLNIWYIDNGYFCRSSPPWSFNGYYRIVLNAPYHTLGINPQLDWKRFYKIHNNVKLHKWRNRGSKIVLVPPTQYVYNVWGINPKTWTNTVIKVIRPQTDRPILVSTKNNKVQLNNKDIWCVITCCSNILVDSLIAGIPVITTHFTNIGSIHNINNPPGEETRDLLATLSHHQWTLDEMRSGKAWNDLKFLYALA